MVIIILFLVILSIPTSHEAETTQSILIVLNTKNEVISLCNKISLEKYNMIGIGIETIETLRHGKKTCNISCQWYPTIFIRSIGFIIRLIIILYNKELYLKGIKELQALGFKKAELNHKLSIWKIKHHYYKLKRIFHINV